MEIGNFEPHKIAQQLLSGQHPNLLDDESGAALVAKVLPKAKSGKSLLTADVGSGARNVAHLLPINQKIWGADLVPPRGVNENTFEAFSEGDVRDVNWMNKEARSFLKANGKSVSQQFDVIVLSSIVNYLTKGTAEGKLLTIGELLDSGQISDVLKTFMRRFVCERLAKNGVLFIQNGDRSSRYEFLPEESVNDVFSAEFDALMSELFSVRFFMAFALVEKTRKRLGWSRFVFPKKQVAELKSLDSLSQAEAISKEVGSRVHRAFFAGVYQKR